MVLRCAALFLYSCGEPQCLSIAARIEPTIDTKAELRVHRMERAMVDLRAYEPFPTEGAFKIL